MANLSTKPSTARHGVVQTKPGLITNLEGGTAKARDAKGDLFILGVSLLYGEPTFYEPKDERAARYRQLVAQVTAEDPSWVQRFLPWLRGTANIRTASIVGAIEYALAGGPGPRSVIRSVIRRADEPAEALAYFKARTGKNPSGGVQRGIADGAVERYDEYAALKYGGSSRTWTPADVISLTRPKPRDQAQADLFAYLQPHRREAEGYEIPETLEMIIARQVVTNSDFREMFKQSPNLMQSAMKKAGMTWEQASGLYGELDAAFWEAMIPSMGYMALLRNLNNFDRVQISADTATTVAERLADPEQVARSRQFPYRFFTAYTNRLSDRYAHALSAAADNAIPNIPELPGKTLILVDSSGSMSGYSLSVRGKAASPGQIAALFGTALTIRNQGRADLVLFDDTTVAVTVPKGTSLLRAVSDITLQMRGGATHTWAALQAHLTDHDRVVILTDMQTQQAFTYGYRSWGMPDKSRTVADVKVPVYNFNLQGYEGTHATLGENFVEFGGGFSDAAFKALPLLEQARKQDWPF